MAGSTQELFDDEFTREVRDAYVALRVRGVPSVEATEAVLYAHRYSALMSPAHAALLWLALAVTQWQQGELLDLTRTRAEAVSADDTWIRFWAVSSHARDWRRDIVGAVRTDLRSPSPSSPPMAFEPPFAADSLNDEERVSLEAVRDALRASEIRVDADPEQMVRAIALHVDQARANGAHCEEHRVSLAEQLAIAWGDAVARANTWEWAAIVDERGVRARAVVRRDRTAFIAPGLHIARHLDDPDAYANVSVELFRMLLDDASPRGCRPALLVSLNDYSCRLADRKWGEQRVQLLSGAAHPAAAPVASAAPVMPGITDDAVAADALEALDALDALDALGDTSCCTSDAPLPEHDPEPAGPPTATMAARRALVLRAVLDHTVAMLPRELLARYSAEWSPAERARFAPDAEVLSRRRVDALRDSGLWTEADDDERALLATPFTSLEPVQLIAASWRAESLGALLWALGRLDVMPPYDEAMSGEMLLALTASIGDGGFVHGATLRPAEEIDRARTIAELWHWRSRTRQLLEEGRRFPGVPGFPVKSWDDVVRYTAPQAVARGLLSHAVDDDFPAFGRAYRDLSADEWARARSIAQERHFALNWLCGYAPGNRWSLTPTDT